MTPEWSRELAQLVMTRRYKAKLPIEQDALVIQLTSYEVRGDLPERLEKEVVACLASGRWRSEVDPLWTGEVIDG